MALTPEDLKRRILAARTLRKLSQPELGQLFKDDGLPRHDAGRIERGDKQARRVHLDAFQRHLRMPEGWWDDPDIDMVLGVTSQPADDEDRRGLDEQLRGGEDEASPAEAPGQTRTPRRARR